MSMMERLAVVVADYFRNKPDAIDGAPAEEIGAVMARSPTVLTYIDVGETDCAEIVRALLAELREPSAEMLEAMVGPLEELSSDLYEGLSWDDGHVKRGWQNAIDAIETPPIAPEAE